MDSCDQQQVSITRSTIVFPSSPTHDTQSMFLTSSDLICRTYPYINRIFFYDIALHDCDAAVSSLQQSLQNVLVQFYPLAGRLAFDKDGRMEVDCNDAGVDFVEAVTPVRLSALQSEGFQYTSLFWKLCKMSDLVRSDFPELPILSVQVTKFEGGGLSVGVSLSHVVVDAQSFYDFIQCWAEECRGVPMTMPPIHMRSALKVETLFPAELPVSDREKEHVAALLEKQHEEEDQRKPRTDLTQKLFTFSAEALQRLKKHASNPGKADFTTFESFCAYWWQALIKARNLPEECPVCLLIPINGRQKFLSLPMAYFGNCLDGGLVSSSAGELCKLDLPTIAAKVHKAIKAVTEETFKDYIKEAESTLRGGSIPHFDRTDLFHISDSPRFPIYGTDFGFGRPIAVRAEGIRFGAEVQIVRGRNARGSMDFFCALPADAMARLEQDPEFCACT